MQSLPIIKSFGRHAKKPPRQASGAVLHTIPHPVLRMVSGTTPDTLPHLTPHTLPRPVLRMIVPRMLLYAVLLVCLLIAQPFWGAATAAAADTPKPETATTDAQPGDQIIQTIRDTPRDLVAPIAFLYLPNMSWDDVINADVSGPDEMPFNSSLQPGAAAQPGTTQPNPASATTPAQAISPPPTQSFIHKLAVANLSAPGNYGIPELLANPNIGLYRCADGSTLSECLPAIQQLLSGLPANCILVVVSAANFDSQAYGQAPGQTPNQEPGKEPSKELTPVLVYGGGFSGYLKSELTHRVGLVTATDLSNLAAWHSDPSITNFSAASSRHSSFRQSSPQGPGIPNTLSSSASGDGLTQRAERMAHEKATIIAVDETKKLASLSFLSLVFFAFALSILLLFLGRRTKPGTRVGLIPALRILWLIVLAFPSATFLMFLVLPALPSGIDLIIAVVFWVALISVAALLYGLYSKWVNSLIALFGLAILVIVVGQIFGGPLNSPGYLTYDITEGSRYYGMGNEQGAILFGSWITLSGLLINRFPDSRSIKHFQRWGYPLGSAFLLFVSCSPWFGASFGPLVWGFLGCFISWWLFNGRRLRWWLIAVLVLGSLALALGVLYIDVLLNPTTHMQQVIPSMQEGPIALVVRIATDVWTYSFSLIENYVPLVVIIFLVFVIILLVVLRVLQPGSFRLFWQRNPAFRAAYSVCFVLAAITFVIEDSGVFTPAVLIIYPVACFVWLVCDLHRWHLRALAEGGIPMTVRELQQRAVELLSHADGDSAPTATDGPGGHDGSGGSGPGGQRPGDAPPDEASLLLQSLIDGQTIAATIKEPEYVEDVRFASLSKADGITPPPVIASSTRNLKARTSLPPESHQTTGALSFNRSDMHQSHANGASLASDFHELPINSRFSHPLEPDANPFRKAESLAARLPAVSIPAPGPIAAGRPVDHLTAVSSPAASQQATLKAAGAGAGRPVGPIAAGHLTATNPPTATTATATATTTDSESKPTVARSTAVMSVATMLSRITGFFRTWAMGYALGTTSLATSYYIANNLPNQLYELVAGGVLTTAFLPIYLAQLEKHGKRGAAAYTGNILSISAIILGLVVLLATVFAPQLIWTQTFLNQDFDIANATFFFRFFAIQVIFYGVGAIISGLLNAHRSFLWPALGPVFNNIVVIITMLGFPFISMASPQTAMVWMAVGTSLGVVTMFIVQLPALIKLKIPLSFRIRLKDPALIDTLKLAGPAAIFVIMNILVVIAMNNFAVAVTEQGPSTILYAMLWYQLPYGVIAVALSTALLTEMSRASAIANWPVFRNNVRLGLRFTMFAIIPLAAIIFTLAAQLAGIYRAGAFTLEDVANVASLLSLWCLALPFYAAYMFIYRAFSAMRDLKRFIIIDSCGRLLQIVLYACFTTGFGLGLGPNLGLLGIPLADACINALLCAVMLFVLRKKIGSFGLSRIVLDCLKLLAAALAAIALPFCILLSDLPSILLGMLLGESSPGILTLGQTPLVSLAVIAVFGLWALLVYYLLCRLFRVPETEIVSALITKVTARIRRSK